MFSRSFPTGFLGIFIAGCVWCHADEPVIDRIVQGEDGLFELTFHGRADSHYLLYRSPELGQVGRLTAMWVGEGGPQTVKDRLYPGSSQLYYRLKEVPNDAAGDFDGDGLDDYTELSRKNIFQPDWPPHNPFNPISDLQEKDGRFRLTWELFEQFSIVGDGVGRESGSLKRFIKFIVLEIDGHPAVIFYNTHRHPSHGSLLELLRTRYDINENPRWRGEIVFDPISRGVNGPGFANGLFTFQFQPNDAPPFEEIRAIHELLTMNMLFIEGNLAYGPFQDMLISYRRDADLYKEAGVPVILPEWLQPEDGYVPLNRGDTFGLLRVIESGERPSIFDVAIFRRLPNDVPLVRGIITEVIQTPLSHVNLRAVQNNNPNAYIRDATTHPAIAPLIGKYVRYTVTNTGFRIIQATKEQVEAHLEELRPRENLTPPRDLEMREIMPLREIGFESSASFGVKASNLAEMHRMIFQLPVGVVPDGFAIPFSFYDTFMRHNGFYEEARAMMADEDFQGDPGIRDQRLETFRDTLKDGEIPEPLREKLTVLQDSFPEGTSIRCRSSTNNEDLPGFNGAGLYSSFTHHPHEGHISKSVKQVFASLWNFLAFEHRDFYRVDHFQAAMGILVHPNFSNEQANGVAVAKDVQALGIAIPRPGGRFYANVQVGEDLVTNPERDSSPEVILFDAFNTIRLAGSNQVEPGEIVLSDEMVQLLYLYLNSINNHFFGLYRGDRATFAMEIEFKITEAGALIVKQARPWVN